MSVTKGVLAPFLSSDLLIDFLLVPQVERDRPIDLFKAEGGEIRANRLWRFTLLKLSHDAVERHTTSSKEKAIIAPLDKLPIWAHCSHQFNAGQRRLPNVAPLARRLRQAARM
jgi:hypothetical protein